MSFDDDESLQETLYELDDAVTCDSVVITIESVYSGTEHSDTGISEVSFYAFDNVSTSSNTSKPAANSEPKCEYSYVVQFRNSSYPDDRALNYDLYTMFDTDTNTVYQFLSTETNFISVGTYKGTITSSGGWEVEVDWDYGDWWYVSGDSESIDVTDPIGYCFNAERISSAEIEAVVDLP